MHSRLKEDILSIINYSLKETSVDKLLSDKIKFDGKILKVSGSSFKISDYNKVYVLGSGKASYSMARSLNSIIGEKIKEGLIIYTQKKKKIGNIKVLKGTHPFPSRESLESTKKILELAERTKKNDLIIYLLSGGTSSLLFYPETSIEDAIDLNTKLIESGKSIKQINRIRKKCSKVKGGKLLNHIDGNVLNLVFSDVVGNDLGFIGSGPLFNPKNKKVKNFIIADNKSLLDRAKEKAESLGYKTKIVWPEYEGSPQNLAKKFLNYSKKMDRGNCIISGGELSSKVRGPGKGGPNQEFVLLCGGISAFVASIDSDGIDGNSGAAGAVADTSSLSGFESYLERSDSYNFFRKKGGLIKTGVTGTNLNDLRVLIKK